MNFTQESLYFGAVLSLLTFWFGSWLKSKTGWAVLNPILVSIVLCIVVLKLLRVDYAVYEAGAKYIGYLLTPTTVCLAIPLYRQLSLLRQNLAAVIIGIFSGVVASAASIFAMCLLFGLNHTYYVSLLPKSITTAIAMGVSEEAGGIVPITIVCIIITGTLGNIIGESIFKWTHLDNPIARGLALGTSAHAVGTAKAMELGEIEGAMSSLAVAVAGLMTVIVVPLVTGFI